MDKYSCFFLELFNLQPIFIYYYFSFPFSFESKYGPLPLPLPYHTFTLHYLVTTLTASSKGFCDFPLFGLVFPPSSGVGTPIWSTRPYLLCISVPITFSLL